MATKRKKPSATGVKSARKGTTAVAKRPPSKATSKRAVSATGKATAKGRAATPDAANGGVEAFLAALPAERRAEAERVRAIVNAKLPRGYVETAQGKYLAWVVPLEVYPDTYNGQALWYAALASGKSGFSLHAMVAYMNEPLTRRIEEGFAAAGKKLDMGKACIRFKRADDLALEVLGEAIASTPLEAYVARAKAAWGRR